MKKNTQHSWKRIYFYFQITENHQLINSKMLLAFRHSHAPYIIDYIMQLSQLPMKLPLWISVAWNILKWIIAYSRQAVGISTIHLIGRARSNYFKKILFILNHRLVIYSDHLNFWVHADRHQQSHAIKLSIEAILSAFRTCLQFCRLALFVCYRCWLHCSCAAMLKQFLQSYLYIRVE